VLGGGVGDSITTANGNDTVCGDYCVITMDSAATCKPSNVAPIDTLWGGSDVIVTGNGFKAIMAGQGSDAIRGGTVKSSFAIMTESNFQYSRYIGTAYRKQRKMSNPYRLCAHAFDTVLNGFLCTFLSEAFSFAVAGNGRNLVCGDHCTMQLDPLTGLPLTIASVSCLFGGMSRIINTEKNALSACCTIQTCVFLANR
jgi:hypothetical protein